MASLVNQDKPTLRGIKENTKFDCLDFTVSNVCRKQRAAAQITIVSSQAGSQPDLLAPLCRQYTTLVLVAAALKYIADHESRAIFVYYRSFC